MIHDANTLDVLWQFDTGIPSRGTPIAYSVGGKEYIAVITAGPVPSGERSNMPRGAMLWVFSL
jgi:hypothetical protein